MFRREVLSVNTALLFRNSYVGCLFVLRDGDRMVLLLTLRLSRFLEAGKELAILDALL